MPGKAKTPTVRTRKLSNDGMIAWHNKELLGLKDSTPGRIAMTGLAIRLHSRDQQRPRACQRHCPRNNAELPIAQGPSCQKSYYFNTIRSSFSWFAILLRNNSSGNSGRAEVHEIARLTWTRSCKLCLRSSVPCCGPLA